MTEEFRQAIKNLKAKIDMYNLATEKFEEVAYYEMKAAQARVNALIKEAKEVLKKNDKDNFQKCD